MFRFLSILSITCIYCVTFASSDIKGPGDATARFHKRDHKVMDRDHKVASDRHKRDHKVAMDNHKRDHKLA